MTDRIQHLTVALDHDIRTDDVQPLIDAIMLLRGVLTVRGNVVDHATFVASVRIRHSLEKKLYAAIHNEDTYA